MPLTQTTGASSLLTTAFNGSVFVATVPVTVAAGDSGLLVRLVGPESRMPPSSVTFDGSACTQITTRDDGNTREVSVFELLTLPVPGTYTLAITTPVGVAAVRTLVTLLNGGGETIQRGTAVNAQGFSTTPTVTVTTVVGDLVFDVGNTTAVPTVGAGQTQQMNADTYSVGSIETASGTSTVMSWTQTSNRWVLAAVPYRVIPGTGPVAAFGRYRIAGARR